MKKTAPVAHIPFLNSLPFYNGLQLGERFSLIECIPRESAAMAQKGELVATLMPLVEFLRRQEHFDRLGHFGVAAKGRAHSAVLFARRPVKQMDGALIGVSPETSTTVCLTRLILEQRYKLIPARYRRVASVQDAELDGVILIGDEALRFKQTNGLFPFEIDMAFEWWLWQHTPCVFAVWVVRKDVAADDRKRLEAGIARALAQNVASFEALSAQAAPKYGMKPADVQAYFESYAYRFGKAEEDGILLLKSLWTEAGILDWDPV